MKELEGELSIALLRGGRHPAGNTPLCQAHAYQCKNLLQLVQSTQTCTERTDFASSNFYSRRKPPQALGIQAAGLKLKRCTQVLEGKPTEPLRLDEPLQAIRVAAPPFTPPEPAEPPRAPRAEPAPLPARRPPVTALQRAPGLARTVTRTPPSAATTGPAAAACPAGSFAAPRL